MIGIPATADASLVEAVELDRAGDDHPELSRVLAYWTLKRQDRFAPRRADIDPVDLVESLSRITLSDVLRTGAAGEALDFRYRLCGTEICTTHWRDPTGQAPRDMRPPAFGALLHDHYTQAVQRRAPMVHLITMTTPDKSRSYVRLLLPLSEDGATVTMLMTVDSKQQNTRALLDYFDKVSRKGPVTRKNE
ncbi:MAG TPA: PAS domain-containing protein [Stellaceae bacterium]|nr:PAS domain-containing protein [Stellaceae bacterium]